VGRVDGKVALITGAARGQGRAHALRLAEEGADIIAVDLCSQLETVPYRLATEADLEETAKQVEDRDRRILTRQADVRDLGQLQAAVADGVSEFGHLDIVCANAGVLSSGPAWELTEESWQEMIDVNLTGVWKTVRAAVPQMIEQGTGGSIVLTSSIFGLQGATNCIHYVAAKHGVTGIMRALALELAPHRIRVNSVHPTTVDTDMVQNPTTYEMLLGRSGATRAEAEVEVKAMNALPIPWVDAVDISNAVLYLASDEARYVTGTTHAVDAGSMSPYKIPHG
jgi:SDR family mycofactocin-dependent oxidoreductase